MNNFVKSFFKFLLYTLGILTLLFCVANQLFPYQTMRTINNIEHYINKSPKEDVIDLDMDKETLLYTINASINGCEMEFILDTGCSCMLMSQVDFNFLKKNGFISHNDYIEDINTTNADGLTSTCKVYNIDELQIGEYVINNVRCAVSEETTAMLLLGQEVLSKFKKVTINYSNNTLKVEI